MIKLLAKNKSDRQYYFTEDGCSVYIINSPLLNSEIKFVDSMDVFQRRSVDASLAFDEQEFESEADLRAYAIRDCTPSEQRIASMRKESLDSLLVYAPIEIVKDYLQMIRERIEQKNFVKLNLFFKQLSNNYLVIDDYSLTQELNKLKTSFNEAKFPNIENRDKANKVVKRIQQDRSVLTTAA